MNDSHGTWRQNLDAFADQIRRTISRQGACQIHGEDLAIIWVGNEALPDPEKRLSVKTFARHYKFRTVVDYGLDSAIFR